MRYFILILSISLFTACNSSKNKKNEDHLNKTISFEETVMLLGEINRNGLKMDAFQEWYDSGYEGYEPDPEIIQELKPLIKDVDITIFMGTWCEDSHRDIPDFFKILDELNYDESRITMFAIDEEKVEPEKEIRDYEIIQVPTFIFYKNGEEINRIVEYSLRSLERDMLDILSGKNYINPYSDF